MHRRYSRACFCACSFIKDLRVLVLPSFDGFSLSENFISYFPLIFLFDRQLDQFTYMYLDRIETCDRAVVRIKDQRQLRAS